MSKSIQWVVTAIVVAAALVVTTTEVVSDRQVRPERQVVRAGPGMFDTVAKTMQMAAMECPPDLQGCTSAREHVRKFKRGQYSRARRIAKYTRPMKRLILKIARAKWKRTKSRPWRSNRYRWRTIINSDTCWASEYGDIRYMCRSRQEYRLARRRGVWVKNVVFCGLEIVPMLLIKGKKERRINIGAGGARCFWNNADRDIR